MSAGLQDERTELAWSRTALTCWVVALITLRTGLPWSAVALIAPVTMTVIALARRRHLASASVPAALDDGVAAVMAAACALVAIVGCLA